MFNRTTLTITYRGAEKHELIIIFFTLVTKLGPRAAEVAAEPVPTPPPTQPPPAATAPAKTER